MQKVAIDHAFERQKAIADGLRDVTADLRLLDAGDVIALIKTGQLAAIACLVQSSIELSFKPGTLTFGHSGDVAVNWDSAPAISFDLELHHEGIHAYFRLMLESCRSDIEITYFSSEGQPRTPAENTKRLAHALRAARLPPGNPQPESGLL